MIIFTSSWDDGSKNDLKLAELLLKHHHKATFFIPLCNPRREVINDVQISDISKNFEVGAHTIHHKYLTTLSDSDAEWEIRNSKLELEKIINRPVHGFCFPGGRFRDVHVKIVKESGFSYARTTNMFKLVNDHFIMNTTLQAYNHKRSTYIYHLMKRGYLTEILKNSIFIAVSPAWDQLLARIIGHMVKYDSADKISVIHLWGHSHDLENNGMWLHLERVLELVNQYHIQSKTNFEVSDLKTGNGQQSYL